MYLDYYVRALPSDWALLLRLGEKLGALQLHQEFSSNLREDGTVATTPVGDPVVTATSPGAWDFIGELLKPTGNSITSPDGVETPEMVPVADSNGVAYWHANLRTTVHLGNAAREAAQTDPEVAAALSEMSRFFLLDEAGFPRLPKAPARVWA